MRRRLVGLTIVSALSATLAVACGADQTGPTVDTATTESTVAAPSTEATGISPTSEVPPAAGDDQSTSDDISTPRLDEVEVAATRLATVDQPVNLAVRTGDSAIFVVGQDGSISRITEDEVVTVADLGAITTARGEQGLLGLAFNERGDLAYVNYTNRDGATVIAEYRVRPSGVFVTESPRILLEIEQPFFNHNGGHLLVDDDGSLLIGMGDGGAAGDPLRLSLDPMSLQGKILRIDPRPSSGQNGADQPYGIPADNPFANGIAGLPEILILGVRNPWKFTIDPATGDLWVADVGQSAVEEATRLVPEQIAGASLGWSAFEGDQRFNDDQPADRHLPPTVVIAHGQGDCSISGGMVYRGANIPALVGAYVFSDYCSGRVYAFDPQTSEMIVLLELPKVTAVLPGPQGEIHVLSHSGEVWQLGSG